MNAIAALDFGGRPELHPSTELSLKERQRASEVLGVPGTANFIEKIS